MVVLAVDERERLAMASSLTEGERLLEGENAADDEEDEEDEGTTTTGCEGVSDSGILLNHELGMVLNLF